MSIAAVSRLVASSNQRNTLNVRTVEIVFQKSPGKSKGGQRGIPGLEFRIEADGQVIRTGKTDKPGLIEVPLTNGEAVLHILLNGTPVSTYAITSDESPLASVETVLGQQQRLRHLGYQLGHRGKDGQPGDGVGADPPPKDVSPLPPRIPDPEEDDDDRAEQKKQKEEDEKRRAGGKIPSGDEKRFEDLPMETERSILDFQADESLLIDGIAGKVTQGKLSSQVKE